jgi:hypothetical protein
MVSSIEAKVKPSSDNAERKTDLLLLTVTASNGLVGVDSGSKRSKIYSWPPCGT